MAHSVSFCFSPYSPGQPVRDFTPCDLLDKPLSQAPSLLPTSFGARYLESVQDMFAVVRVRVR